MIRVNLLHNRREAMHRLASEPGGASAFISGKEVLLAAVFLVLGAAILWFVLANSAAPPDSEAIVAEEVSPSGETSIPPEAAPETAQQGAAPEPSDTGASDPGSADSDTRDPGSADSDTRDSDTPDAGTLIPETAAAETATSKTAAVKNLAPDTVAQAGASPEASALSVTPEPAPPASVRDSSPAAAVARPVSASPPPSQPASQRASQPASTSISRSPSVDPSGASSSGLSAPAGAVTLSAVNVLDVAGGLQIFAATTGRPEYKLFRVENPNRVVIDMPGTWMEIPREGREQQVSHSIIKQLRVAQNQLDPPMVRLVLEVSSFPELQVVPREDGLTISVTGE
jgi:cytoskeletal protein RodZ